MPALPVPGSPAEFPGPDHRARLREGHEVVDRPDGIRITPTLYKREDLGALRAHGVRRHVHRVRVLVRAAIIDIHIELAIIQSSQRSIDHSIELQPATGFAYTEHDVLTGVERPAVDLLGQLRDIAEIVGIDCDGIAGRTGATTIVGVLSDSQCNGDRAIDGRTTDVGRINRYGVLIRLR